MCTAAILKFFPHSLERAGSTARIQKLVGACKLEKNLTEEQVLKHFLTSRGEAISTEGWAAVAGGKIHLANGAHLDTERPFNRHTTKGYKVNPSTSVHNFLCSCALILRVTSWRDTSKTQLTLRAGIQQSSSSGKSARLPSGAVLALHTQQTWAWPCKSRRRKTVRISLLVAASLQGTRNCYSPLLTEEYNSLLPFPSHERLPPHTLCVPHHGQLKEQKFHL